MGTQVHLDDDVAGLVKRLSRERNRSADEIVNEALREGLSRTSSRRSSQARRFRTEPVSLGGCLLENLDDVAEALAFGEGESFK